MITISCTFVALNRKFFIWNLLFFQSFLAHCRIPVKDIFPYLFMLVEKLICTFICLSDISPGLPANFLQRIFARLLKSRIFHFIRSILLCYFTVLPPEFFKVDLKFWVKAWDFSSKGLWPLFFAPGQGLTFLHFFLLRTNMHEVANYEQINLLKQN